MDSNYNQKKKELKKLNQIFQAPDKKQTTIGVVMDATFPYKTPNSKDYITQLKIIDESLNFTTNQELEKKYIHVFIFQEDRQDSPVVQQIGDIVYLKLFDFYQYNDEISSKKQNYSNYYLFEGGNTSDNDFSLQQTSAEIEGEYKANELVQSRIKFLRQWSRQFFANQSILQMNWYGEMLINQNQLEVNDFDMLLKVNNIITSQDLESYVSYVLVDGEENKFYLQFPDCKLNIDDIIKIRSIKKIKVDRRMEMNIYSSLIKLPEFFLDYQKFDQNIIYQIIYREDELIKLEETVFFDTNDREFDNSIIDKSTRIKQKYREMHETKSFTTFKELERCRDQFIQKQEGNVHNQMSKFKVQGYIVDIQPENFNQAVKNYCKFCNTMYPLNHKENECCTRPLSRVWHLSIICKDFSIDLENKCQEIHVFTYDDNPQNIIPGINLNNYEEYQNYSLRYKEIRQDLIENSSLDFPFEFIIEPLIGERYVTFRVVDTKFIF